MTGFTLSSRIKCYKKQIHYGAEPFTYVFLGVTTCPADMLVSLWLMGTLNVPKQHPPTAISVLFSVSQSSAVSGSILSNLISSPVGSLQPEGQLLPTLGPVIYWAPFYCRWLPSGRQSGLRFSQTTVSLQIIIRLRPAEWHASTGPLLLIELDLMLQVTEKWTVSPSEPCDLLEQGSRFRMACGCLRFMCLTQHLSYIHSDTDFSARFHFMMCVNWGQVQWTIRNPSGFPPGDREHRRPLFIVPPFCQVQGNLLASYC